MSNMNTIETLKFVRDKLLEQGKPSSNSVGICMYRHETLKCGVGHLIPDSIYKPQMDGVGHNKGMAISDVLMDFPEIEDHVRPTDIKDYELLERLLIDIQNAHDTSDRGDSFKSDIVCHFDDLIQQYGAEGRLERGY